MAFMPFDAVTNATMSVLMDEINGIATELLTESDLIAEVEFSKVPTSTEQFGGSSSGRMLGYEHDRAHKVMTGTLSGVIQDLRDFHEGMQKAGREAIDADEISAADMTRIQKLAEMSNTSAETSESQDEAAAGDTDTEDETPPSSDTPPGSETPPSSDTPPASDNDGGEN